MFFERLGRLITQRKKSFLLASIILAIAAGGIGSQVFTRFDSGGYSNPKSDSAKVWDYLKNTFESRDPSIVFAVNAPGSNIDDPVIVDSAKRLESQIAQEPGVEIGRAHV